MKDKTEKIEYFYLFEFCIYICIYLREKERQIIETALLAKILPSESLLMSLALALLLLLLEP
jgi:uncharacterized protein with von Willebrand factor type A (vWA) domain